MRIGYSTTICRMSDTNTVKNTDTNAINNTDTNTLKITNTIKKYKYNEKYKFRYRFQQEATCLYQRACLAHPRTPGQVNLKTFWKSEQPKLDISDFS